MYLKKYFTGIAMIVKLVYLLKVFSNLFVKVIKI